MNLHQLSAKLDDLIELAEYNPKVLESVWRKIKKPSRRGLAEMYKSTRGTNADRIRLTTDSLIRQDKEKLDRMRKTYPKDWYSRVKLAH